MFCVNSQPIHLVLIIFAYLSYLRSNSIFTFFVFFIFTLSVLMIIFSPSLFLPSRIYISVVSLPWRRF